MKYATENPKLYIAHLCNVMEISITKEHCMQTQPQSHGGASKGKLSLLAFFSITASMVMTVYELPSFATSGFALVFFLLLGGFLWFIPVALCSAEMATVEGWEEGGIFSWVGNTLGERFGFAAIFFQWFQITTGFVVMIYFILGALSYLFDYPELNTNPLLKFLGVLIIFWSLTLSQIKGTKNTARIAKAGFFIGIVAPVCILIVLGIMYIASGRHVMITMDWETFMPNFSKPSTLVIFVSFVLAYMGVEASASHVNEMENPKRDYPIVIFILAILAIIINTIGGLTIAFVIPLEELSLSTGVIQTFATLILYYGKEYSWIVKVIAIMISIGVIGEISSWVVGPSKGMYTASQRGLLPSYFTKVNEYNVPVRLIMVQGIIVSIWAAIFTFSSGSASNLSFMTAMSLTVVIYIIAYILFFIGYLVLIYKKRTLPRAYSVPGGIVVKTLLALLGLATSLFALVISFFPPSTLPDSNIATYETLLTVCSLIAILIPYILYAYRKHYKPTMNNTISQ